MNINRFLKRLQGALKTAATPDTFSPDDINSALLAAVLAYSRYRPAVRRIGTGILVQAAQAGSQTLTALGGPFSVGQTLHLDSLGYAPETVAVTALASAPLGEEDAIEGVSISLAAPLQSAHSGGAYLTPDAPGLPLLSGVGMYALPSDWMGVDQESFDLATGAGPKANGFYDGAYRQSALLSGTGYGQRSDFGGGGYGASVFGPTGYIGQPANACGSMRYQFVDDAPARLIITPPPSESRLLDFSYRGCHAPQTVPEADSDALVFYAAYVALLAQAGLMGGQSDYALGTSVKESPTKAGDTLLSIAAAARAQWERLVVNVPYASGG